jgi:hypothetical protein
MACWDQIDGEADARTDRRAEVRADRAASEESHDEADSCACREADAQKMYRLAVSVGWPVHRHRAPPYLTSGLVTINLARQSRRTRRSAHDVMDRDDPGEPLDVLATPGGQTAAGHVQRRRGDCEAECVSAKPCSEVCPAGLAQQREVPLLVIGSTSRAV